MLRAERGRQRTTGEVLDFAFALIRVLGVIKERNSWSTLCLLVRIMVSDGSDEVAGKLHPVPRFLLTGSTSVKKATKI